jgi:RNA polymerase sigma-70 factor (ECF subfamily)
MDDNRIIELFFNRDEGAIEQARDKYGRYLSTLLYNILGDREDCEECENDTYFRAWNSIPPTRPTSLIAYLSKIARNLALDRLRDEKKRPALKTALILDEISEIIPDSSVDMCDELSLRDVMRDFVRGLDPIRRKIFLQRYFYMLSVREIAREVKMPEGTVKTQLFRIRQSLRDYLKERGIEI